MGIWDSKCVWYTLQLGENIGFQDIYREWDGKWLLDSIGIWDRKWVWDIIWLQGTI